jgi:hypothetical protein
MCLRHFSDVTITMLISGVYTSVLVSVGGGGVFSYTLNAYDINVRGCYQNCVKL